jgi:glycosidase
MSITRWKIFLGLWLACFVSTSALSQALARPGWAGFVTKSDAWWKNSTVYEIDPHGFGGLKGVTEHLDYVHSLGSDAILLTHFQPDPAHPQEIDSAVGSFDDLDELIHQASSRNMRVLVDLGELPPAIDLTSIARYWLNRGVAGFHIAGAEQAVQLRKIASSYIGQRIVIGDLDPANASGRDRPQLLLDARLSKINQLTAANLRPAMEAIAATDNALLATDAPETARSIVRFGDGQHDADIAKVLATLLFANPASALLYYGQEIGLRPAKAETGSGATMLWGATPSQAATITASAAKPLHPVAASEPGSVAAAEADPASLLNWYRRLSALHQSNPTLGSAAMTVLNHDDQNVLAWVRKPAAASYKKPPVVVICNLSAQPVHLSLKDDMQKLRLKGSFLRTVIRSDSGMGPMTLDSMTIPAYSVYIGELRY